MKTPQIKGLYAIADGKWNPFKTSRELVQRFLEGGCRIVQLRMKTEKEKVLFEAESVMQLKKKYDFTFIINDDADIALKIGADGVHVGENDTPVSHIKEKYGNRLIVGYSSHSIEEALLAEKNGADYIAFGAIYPTKTKGPGHPVQGISKLKELVERMQPPLPLRERVGERRGLPVVAIGGITRKNVDDVIRTGVFSFAMITALCEAKNIVEEVKWFTNLKCNY